VKARWATSYGRETLPVSLSFCNGSTKINKNREKILVDSALRWFVERVCASVCVWNGQSEYVERSLLETTRSFDWPIPDQRLTSPC
jgi:hypothetical protein